MSYKRNANANRDALFGGNGGGTKTKSSSSRPSNAAKNRDVLFGGSAANSSSGGGGNGKPRVATATTTSQPPMTTTRTVVNRHKKPKKPALRGEAREAKLKQAAEFRDKANKCMTSSFFTKPDPVAASTYFKRAADAYQQAGDEDRLERLYRQESAACNMQIGAWASAASDYCRAAELLIPKNSTVDDIDDLPEAPEYPTLAKRRFAASVFYKEAGKAFTEMNERAKAAQCKVKAAIALNFGDASRMLSQESLTEMEEAIEAHLPDVFNPHARYRQTGSSAFCGPDETVDNPSKESLELAEAHVVTKAYSHEALFDLVYFLCDYGEYASALYAVGAASALLEKENLSTLTLSRSYLMETVVMLAMGDPVAAEQHFLTRHVQKTFYLAARECKLAEDLFRAVKMRDAAALDEARSPTGSNRAALANLHSSLRTVVQEIRLSGVARKHIGGSNASDMAAKTKKKSGDKKAAASSTPEPASERSLQELAGLKTGYEDDVAAGANLDSDALANELDALDFDLGDDGNDEDEDDSLEDDDFDLR